MKKLRFIIIAVAFTAAVCGTVFAGGSAEGAKYPSHPVEVVVPWGAGGVTDVVARNFLPLCEPELGVTLPVVNKPGASGAVGTQYVLGKPADGYTVLFSAETPGMMKIMGAADIDFHDFEPIILIGNFAPTVVVAANAPWNSVEELIADAKRNPGKIVAGYASPASTGHVASLLFSTYADAKFNIVPFGDGAKTMAALLGGHVGVIFNPLSSVIENYKGGKVKLLATFTNVPVPQIPEVPALGAKVKSFEKVLPWGPIISILVKKGTPEPVMARLRETAAKAVKQQAWRDFAKNYCIDTLGFQGAEFWTYVDGWVSTTTWLLYDAGTAKRSPADFGIPRPK